MNEPDPTAHLRQLSPEALAQVGEAHLREHLQAQAVVAHHQYAPLTFEKLERLLHDPACVRYPTRLVFEFGPMAAHQFAQPDLDPHDLQAGGRVLYLRPLLRERPDLTVLAVAYMLPAINYGALITDDHCLLYGATLLGLTEDEFYQQICALADLAGSETRMRSQG